MCFGFSARVTGAEAGAEGPVGTKSPLKQLDGGVCYHLSSWPSEVQAVEKSGCWRLLYCWLRGVWGLAHVNVTPDMTVLLPK